MDRPLGTAGRARRIEPEGGVVGVGPGGTGERGLRLEEGLELRLAEFERLGRTRDDDLVDLVIRLHQRGLERGLRRAADEGGLRARMLEHVGVVVGGEHRVDRDRNDACEERPQEDDRPVVRVEHEDKHALLALDACVLQRGRATADALIERAVGQRAHVVDEGDLVSAPRVRLEEMPGEVENLRRRWNALAQLCRLLPVVSRK